jgi:hypothetical protein
VLDRSQHREKLIQFLLKIYQDSFLAPLLGFKGGTAVYLFYKLNRFSVDLDFDLLDKEQEEKVHSKICSYAEELGQIKDETIKFYGPLAVFSYEKGKQQVKIEISNRETCSSYEVKQLLGCPIKVMVKSDMFSNKLLACYERMAVRDIFDVYFMFNSNWDYNSDLINQRSGKNLVDFFSALVKKLSEFDANNVLADLGHLVDTPKQKSWAKTKMKEETLMRLRIHLDSLENAL